MTLGSNIVLALLHRLTKKNLNNNNATYTKTASNNEIIFDLLQENKKIKIQTFHPIFPEEFEEQKGTPKKNRVSSFPLFH